MKAEKMRELGTDELMARLAAKKEEHFNLRFQLATGQLEKTSQLKQVKREIARIATVIRETDLKNKSE